MKVCSPEYNFTKKISRKYFHESFSSRILFTKTFWQFLKFPWHAKKNVVTSFPKDVLTVYKISLLWTCTMQPKVEGNKLLLDGYVYYRSRRAKNKTYWDCNKLRAKECTARAITNEPDPSQPLVVLKGPTESPHLHPPNQEELSALQKTNDIKWKAAENPAKNLQHDCWGMNWQMFHRRFYLSYRSENLWRRQSAG